MRFASLCVGSLIAIGAGFLAGCGDAKTPAGPARVIESVTIGGARPLVEGETNTLVATVRWSNGTTETPTSGVAWVSDDPRTASVDQRGVVTALAAGDGRIRATYNSVTGTTSFRVNARAREFSGRIHQSIPTEDVPVAGATVAATGADGSSQSAVTDGTGRFTLSLVPGAAQFTVSAAGYETATTTVDLTGADISLPLVPVARDVHEKFEPPAAAADIRSRTYRITVHHAGELRAAYTGSSALASDWAFVSIEVRDGANQRLAFSVGQYDLSPDPIRLSVSPGVYEVTFAALESRGGGSIPFGKFSGELKYRD